MGRVSNYKHLTFGQVLVDTLVVDYLKFKLSKKKLDSFIT